MIIRALFDQYISVFRAHYDQYLTISYQSKSWANESNIDNDHIFVTKVLFWAFESNTNNDHILVCEVWFWALISASYDQILDFSSHIISTLKLGIRLLTDNYWIK